MKNFLVESALLTHGLVSISNEMMIEMWPNGADNIVWIDHGRIVIDGIEAFTHFRNRKDELVRIDGAHVEEAMTNKVSGALTASGTMKVCEMKKIPLAVSCGLGGICDIKGEEHCMDLDMIRDSSVTLIATAFKDVVDIENSIKWLIDEKVKVYGIEQDRATGYIFKSTDAVMSGKIRKTGMSEILTIIGEDSSIHALLLNPIPEEKRIQNIDILRKGKNKGKIAESQGQYYHPAANQFFDIATFGESSQIQFEALIDNIKLIPNDGGCVS